MEPEQPRRLSKREAANAAAMAIIFQQATLDDFQALGESLVAQGLTARQLTAVFHGIAPFLAVEGAPVAPTPSSSTPPPPPTPTPANRSVSGDREPSETQELRDLALDQIEAATGSRPVRRRGQTYTAANGKALHLRTMRPHDRGHGRTSYWFGLHVDLWGPNDVFALVCGTAGLVIAPATDWEKFRPFLPTAKDDTEIQPNIWLVDGRFELRSDGDHIDVTEWVDNFGPLQDG